MARLITDRDTDMVFFSKYLKTYRNWESICNVLNLFEIKWVLLSDTEDIWARDFSYGAYFPPAKSSELCLPKY